MKVSTTEVNGNGSSKFSSFFLGRDQSYLTRLSSYVSKNLTSGGSSSSNSNANLTSKSSSICSRSGKNYGESGGRRGLGNLMVFSSIDCSEKETEIVSDENSTKTMARVFI